MASPSVTYTFANSTAADATQVNTNFTDLINGASDGTKDYSINALTCAGTATLNGNVNLGNSSADDLTITASLASSLPIKTTNSYDIGSTTLGLRALFLGANSQTVKQIGSASMSATWTFTWPVSAGTSRYRLETDGSGVGSWQPTYRSGDDRHNIGLSCSVAASALTIALKGADGNDPSSTNPVDIVFRSATAATGTATARSVTSALTLVISSGSTLGHISAKSNELWVYAIDNAGTIELAVSSRLFDTNSIQSTTAEGGAGASDSATTIYSTTARTNVATRLIGRLLSTQTTAGTWAAVPTEISVAPELIPLRGVTTGTTAIDGYVGEQIEGLYSGTFGPASNTWDDAVSISLTAGDWDVSAMGTFDFGSSSTITIYDLGVSIQSGNNPAGLTTGQNRAQAQQGSSSWHTSLSIPNYRINITTTTTYYLKIKMVFASGQPNFVGGRISARRVR